MKKLLTTLAVITATSAAAEEGPFGIWQTITDETGAHLLVDIQPCVDAADKLCGTISEVVNSDDPAANDLLGRPIFWDLEKVEDNKWANGRLFDVLSGEEYDAQVILGKTAIRLEGCVATFCDGQNWKRPAG